LTILGNIEQSLEIAEKEAELKMIELKKAGKEESQQYFEAKGEVNAFRVSQINIRLVIALLKPR
jgi:hypothetical protein